MTGRITMFASATLTEHLVRGIAAALLLYLAVSFVDRSVAAAIVFSGVALVLLRGCPMCWAVGLAEMLGARRRRCSSCPPQASSMSDRSGDLR